MLVAGAPWPAEHDASGGALPGPAPLVDVSLRVAGVRLTPNLCCCE